MPVPRAPNLEAREKTMRQMTLIGFLQAQNCTNFAASWRHPDSRTDFLSVAYYQQIARVLEAGKFDLAFFEDRLALPHLQGGAHGPQVSHGIHCGTLAPATDLRDMERATHRHRPSPT